jgi:sec-independent protein translocase protein TatA
MPPCLLGFFGLGHWELLVILAVLLLLFGHRLPGLMRSLGRGVTEFKRGVNDPLEAPDADADESAHTKAGNGGS